MKRDRALRRTGNGTVDWGWGGMKKSMSRVTGLANGRNRNNLLEKNKSYVQLESLMNWK